VQTGHDYEHMQHPQFTISLEIDSQLHVVFYTCSGTSMQSRTSTEEDIGSHWSRQKTPGGSIVA